MVAGQADLQALVLAGKRDGALDPLAAAAGVSHKCLVEVGGTAMIGHPLAALERSPAVGRIAVVIDDSAALDGVDAIRRLGAEGRLMVVPAQRNLVDSVIGAAEAIGAFPLLVTTADNVLLTPAAVADFDRTARAAGADVAVAFARREAVLAAHPDGQRRFYRFRCGAYSNCNLYWVGNARALAATEVFRSGGQFAKHPLRILRAFGLVNLVRFRFGLGTLEGSFARFSKRFGLAAKAVVIEQGEVAIDVDNARTKAVAEQILAERPRSPAA